MAIPAAMAIAIAQRRVLLFLRAMVTIVLEQMLTSGPAC
jgi:hypothetical protein